MTSKERWERVEHLYHAALEHELAARPSFLQDACSDEDLRRDVETLLKYDQRAASFIEGPAIEHEVRAIAAELGPDQAAPDNVGPYRLLSELGRGGMGEVYLALDARLDRKVAIKLLPMEFTADSGRAQRFKREARAASALNHPNILTIYEIGEIDGRHYLATEYIEGETLRQRIAAAAPNPINFKDALSVATQVADALDAANQAGIIHRDVKPENVMIRKDGLVKVLDFGLAKLSADSRPPEDRFSTQTGVVMGTVSYMSPEQARGQKVDHRADVFSLGVLLYEMLSGRKPFDGETQSDVIASLLTKEPPDLDQVAGAIPPVVRRIVKRCLEKLPEKRFQSATDLAFALRESVALRASESSSPRSGRLLRLWPKRAVSSVGNGVSTTLPVVPEVKDAQPGRNRLRWIAAAGLAVLSLGAAALVINYFSNLPDGKAAVSFNISLPDRWAFRLFDGPVVSPDGKNIVFSAKSLSVATGEGLSLWVRRLDSSEVKLVPGGKGGMSPFWSPDSRSVAFWANGQLRRTDISEGSTTTVCETGYLLPGTWNRDGVLLFTSGSKLNRVSAAGAPATVFEPFAEGEIGQHNPRFLPDGRRFLYFSQNRAPQADGIYAASLDADAQRKLIVKGGLLAEYVTPGYLLFTRGNTLMAQRFDLNRLELTGDPVPVGDKVATYSGSSALAPFAAFSSSTDGVLAWKPLTGGDRTAPSDNNLTQMTWFDLSGKELGKVGDPGMYSAPALSPDENRVVVGVTDPNTNTRDLWIMPVSGGAGTRLTWDKADDLNPIWSADGDWIVFTSDRSRVRNIYRKRANGSGEAEPLLESAEPKNVEHISSDGKLVFFNVRSPEETEPDIAVFPANGARNYIRFKRPNSREDAAQLSPDGRWLAFRSTEGGASQIYVQPFSKTGSTLVATWQISRGGGATQPYWRGDGKELYYLERSTLMAVEVKARGSGFSAGNPRPLFNANIEAEERRNRYVVTKDGLRFLVLSRVETAPESTIAVRLNWQAAAK